MQTDSYRTWLGQFGRRATTISTYVYDAKRVEKHYGDLDELYTTDRLAGVLQELRYSAEDARRNKLNPSKIPIDGNPYNSLAAYKSTVTRYCEFRDAGGGDTVVPSEDEGRGRLIGLERDLQAALRCSIKQLEPGLDIIGGGTERSVESGFVDITAKAADDSIVVIELKAGTARRDAVGQILSYMGDVAAEEPGQVRGILVAGDFDGKARAAARVVPSLSLRRYSVTFEFRPAEDAAS